MIVPVEVAAGIAVAVERVDGVHQTGPDTRAQSWMPVNSKDCARKLERMPWLVWARSIPSVPPRLRANYGAVVETHVLACWDHNMWAGTPLGPAPSMVCRIQRSVGPAHEKRRRSTSEGCGRSMRNLELKLLF